MRIGLFDSGIGGLTLLECALRYLPEEEYFFYADSDHVPYGEKKKEEILQYSEIAVQFLIQQGCDVIVIACNTATSVAAARLREKYDLPIIGIEPAVKPAVEHSNHKRVLVMATETTVREKKLKELVDRVDEEHLVDMIAMPGFVKYAERGEFENENIVDYIRSQLKGKRISDYSEVVLGCTHFNHFAKQIKEVFGADCEILDGSEGTIRNLVRIVQEKQLPSHGKCEITYFQSGRRVTDSKTLAFYEKVLNRLKIRQLVDL